jgi:mannosyltransferase OCH1-like enzyme
MIPKIIHYCWFGGNEKSEFILSCMESWKFYLPDYEIVEWNETNFNIELNIFTKDAYSKKKWAFVSDYVRAYALYNCGGVYLDTDVEIRKSLNSFLVHDAFSGFETTGFPFTAVWGARKNHYWCQQILKYYDSQTVFSDITNTKIVSDFLIDNYKIDPLKNELQNLGDGICIYPSNYFCMNIEKNYAVHHFQGSWLEDNSNNNNSHLIKAFYKENFFSYYNKKQILNDLYSDNIFDLKDLICFILKRMSKSIKNEFRKLM